MTAIRKVIELDGKRKVKGKGRTKIPEVTEEERWFELQGVSFLRETL